MLAEFKLAVTRASSTGRSGAARVSVVVRAVPPAGELPDWVTTVVGSCIQYNPKARPGCDQIVQGLKHVVADA